MFSTLENKSIEHIEIVKALLDVHKDTISKTELSTVREKIKVYSLSASVTRLYAIYESFVTTALSDYLDSLCELVPFSSLPIELKNNYRVGISHLLSRTSNFKSISHEEIVKWYYEAISGHEKYRFVTKALARHEQNFRLNVLESILNKIQLKNIKPWLYNHQEIIALYSETDSVSDQLESEIKDFIQLRNDASHTILDSLEGEDNLIRMCDIIKAMIIAISSFLRKSLLLEMLKANKINELGIVTESFPKNGAFIFRLNKGESLHINDKIYLLSSQNCKIEFVKSIMLNDVSQSSATSHKESQQVGVMCKSQVKTKTRLFVVRNDDE